MLTPVNRYIQNIIQNSSLDIQGTCERMYDGMSVWIPMSQISYLPRNLRSSDTENVKIVTPYFDREMNPRVGSPELDSRPNQEILFFSSASRHFLGRSRHPAYWIPRFFAGV